MYVTFGCRNSDVATFSRSPEKRGKKESLSSDQGHKIGKQNYCLYIYIYKMCICENQVKKINL